MSGIVGMINRDGAPVDRELLDRMTAYLSFRGPDSQAVWVDGAVGLGHSLLRTTWESEHEQQPCSLDGQVWITADARIDDRANLIKKLLGQGREASLDRPDVELILHAYHAWGERCVEHLLGDFAFAIWDGRERRLFCARDHFGIKPFFYAVVNGCFVFSNTLNCVRLHPDVSDKLNDLAIADFLLFECNQDVATSAFTDVRRLPPAHTLTFSGATARVDRYWTLPVDGDIRYQRGDEYVEHFKSLLCEAVGDRLRTSRVAIFMSGGMDSTAVAAVSRRLAPADPRPVELRAFTMVFDWLIPDEERTCAGQAAQALEIPVHFTSLDAYGLFAGWERPELETSEPCPWFLPRQGIHAIFEEAAGHSRVVLTGLGADPAMYGSSTYFLSLLREGNWGRLAVDMWHYLRNGHLPKVGFRARVRRWIHRQRTQIALPVWLNPEFAERLELAGRWSRINATPKDVHPRRPEAWRSLTAPMWPTLLGSRSDQNDTHALFEQRHPFFDLRVLKFLLAIPQPWCDNKELLRASMTDLLPREVCRRPKSPFAGNPVRESLQHKDSSWVDHFEAAPELEAYVVRDRVPRLLGELDEPTIDVNLLPISLNCWLARRNYAVALAKTPLESQPMSITKLGSSVRPRPLGTTPVSTALYS